LTKNNNNYLSPKGNLKPHDRQAREQKSDKIDKKFPTATIHFIDTQKMLAIRSSI